MKWAEKNEVARVEGKKKESKWESGKLDKRHCADCFWWTTAGGKQQIKSWKYVTAFNSFDNVAHYTEHFSIPLSLLAGHETKTENFQLLFPWTHLQILQSNVIGEGGKPVLYVLVQITDTLQILKEGDTILCRQNGARLAHSETKIYFALPATGIFTVFHHFQNCLSL